MADDLLDKWAGKAPVPPPPQSDDDFSNVDEFMLNWLHVVLMGGSVSAGNLRRVHDDFVGAAKQAGLKLWELEWLKKRLATDDLKSEPTDK